jgi:hypothetical protein
MAITINHGNIVTALGLAAQSGNAERNRTVAAQDLDFLRTIQGAQSDADRNYAQQISLALADKQHTAENALQAKALEQKTTDNQREQANIDRQYTLNAANAKALQDYRGGNLDIARQHQSLREDAQGLRQEKYDTQQDAIAGLDPSLQNIVQATGRLPYIPSNIGQDTDGKALETEFTRVSRAIVAAQKARDSASYSSDPKDLLGPRGQQSKKVPGAAAGMESQYQDAAQQLATYQQRQHQLDAALNQRSQTLLGGAGNTGQIAAANTLQFIRSLGGQGGQPAAAPLLPGVPSDLPPGYTPANTPGSRGVITPDIAAAYLRRVGGPAHIAEAKAAAVADGWIVP